MLAFKCPRTEKMEDWIRRVITYPCYATPKIDGIRCLTTGDGVPVPGAISIPYTRSLKNVPNHHVSDSVAMCPPWLDGELTVGLNFQNSTSGIMSHHGMPQFTYWVFDCRINEGLYPPRVFVPYEERVKSLFDLKLPPFCNPLMPQVLKSLDDLYSYETQCLERGAEGVMVRPANSPYMDGRRASARWPVLVAVKRFMDSEARVIAVEQLQHNENPAERNALGYLERPTNRVNMVLLDKVGSLVCVDLKTKVEFRIGTGMDDSDRVSWWRDQRLVVGRVVKYKYQPHGVKEKPRCPVFLGFRDPIDMDWNPEQITLKLL